MTLEEFRSLAVKGESIHDIVDGHCRTLGIDPAERCRVPEFVAKCANAPVEAIEPLRGCNTLPDEC